MRAFFNSSSALTTILVCFLSSSVFAQSGATVGAIAGTIKDSQGNVIIGAEIIATQKETGLKRTVQTNNYGIYSLLQLPPGTYEVRVLAKDFVEKAENLTLNIGLTALLEFELVPVGESAIVEVLASDSVVSDKTESSTQIRKDSIEKLPILSRSFLDLSFTTARVTTNRIPEATVSRSSGISVNSQLSRFNNVTIDGLSNNDITSGKARSIFSQDAIQEFQIIPDSYSAEFGRALGGVINIVTKNGSNSFHGATFGLLNDSNLSAKNAFLPNKSESDRYQLGLNLGGPIKKDKAFFFFAFERFLEKKIVVVTILEEVIAAAKRQNFAISNGNVSIPTTSSSVIAKGQFNLNEKNFLSIRYNGDFTYNGNFDPPGGTSDLTNGAFSILNNQAVALNNTYVSSDSNLINETRFLYANLDERNIPYGEGPRVGIAIQDGVLFGRGRLFPQPRRENIYQIVNNTTLIKGRNQIKFGIDLNISQVSGQISLFGQGTASFDPLDFTELSGIPNLPKFSVLEAFDPTLRSREQRNFLNFLAEVLPGMFPGFPNNQDLKNFSLPTAYTQGFGSRFRNIPTKLLSGFFQNDIKLKPNFVFKMGVRYDLNRIRSLPNNNGNFSPRLAFSYRPISKLNISAAYGLFFSVPLSGPAILIENSKEDRLQLLTLVFPFSIIPFSLPKHRFEESLEPPKEFSLIRQFGNEFLYQRDLRNSYNQQAKFGLEYTIDNNTKITADYIFVRGLKLFSSRDINPIINPKNNILDTILTGRLEPDKGRVIQYESAYDSYYHGITLGIEKIFNNGTSFLAHYTYSKTIDNILDFTNTNITNTLDIGLERSLSLQDLRSNFVLSGIWKTKAETKWVKDFQFSTILNLQSGRPYNLFTDDLNKDTVRGDRPLDLGRNAGVAPGFASVDLRVSRLLKLKEKVNLEGFVEAFNLFNRVNILSESDPGVFFAPEKDGSFILPSKQGSRFSLPKEKQVTSLGARIVQIGFRVSF
jgi:hypothetical protein